MKKILVTGGAGYLGSHVVKQLLENDYKVRVLDDLSFGQNGIKKIKNNPNFQLLKGDIRDLQSVFKSMEGVDSVIHLAGIVGDPASKIDPIMSTEINYLSTKLIVDATNYFNIKQFIFASTCSVYGASNNELLNEKSKVNPVSIYAETKLKSEKIILDSYNKNFNPIIFRTGTLFGYSDRMRFDLVINFLTGQATTNKKITIEGGDQWRPFIHVHDAARAYLAALEKTPSKSNNILNLGGDDLNFQLKDIGNMVHKSIDNVKINFTKNIDRRNYRVSFAKIGKILKFEPEKTVDDGVREISSALKSRKIQNWENPLYYNNKFPFIGISKLSKYYWQ